MTPHTRKLMSLSDISSNTSSSPPPSSSSSFNGYKLNPPFDSSMALTALVLLSALFFMAIFSLYIRRFSDTNSHSLDLYRRRQGLTRAPKGVEPAVVMSLPVRAFHAPGKRVGVTNYECVICLSEFEESERVKVIPSCGHVFHVGCIDTWLECHVTCPICRTEEFFVAVDDVEERGSGVVRVQGESGGVELVGPMGDQEV